jgi:uncharacterized protein YukE
MSRSTGSRFALALLGCVLAGCSSGGGAGSTGESKKAVESIRGTRQELVKAKQEVQQANAALDKLVAGGNVGQSYSQFTKEVADVKAGGDRARARAQDMRERGRQYVANWEKETEQITSPELKAGAEQRRAKVKQNYDEITSAAHAARDAYQPYLRDLQDIQRALANDLTPAGVDAAKSAIEKAKANGETLQQRLDTLIAELDEVGGSMSPAGERQAASK